MSFFGTVALVASKDLRAEVRGRHAFNLLLPFAGATLIVFGLALGPGKDVLQPAAPALLWVTILFSTLLGVRRSFEMEDEDGALDGLLMSAADMGAIYTGKVVALVVSLLALEAVAGLLAVILFDLTVAGHPLVLVGSMILGTLGLVSVACLFAALVVRSRAREALLPVLVFPLVVPVTLGAIKTSSLGFIGVAGQARSWSLLLIAFDAVFLSAGTLLFASMMED